MNLPFFSSNTETPAPQPATAPQPNAAEVTPEDQPTTPPAEEKTGLDTFMSLLDNKPKSDVGQPPAPLTAKGFLTTETIDKLADGQDFTTNINPEILAGLTEGKPEALMQLVNAVAKESYKSAIQHAGLLQDNVLSSQLDHYNTSVNDRISTNNSDQELLASMPEIKNPIVKLGLEGVTSKIKQANPDWTGAQVATEAKRYLSELNKVFNPSAEPPAPEDDFDFLDFATK